MRKVIFNFVAILMLTAGSLVAQGPPKAPLTQKELTGLMKSNNAPKVPAILEERGVDFEMTPEIEKKLRKVRADDFLIALIKRSGPAARAERAAKLDGTPPVTPREMKEFKAIQNELNPDVGLQLAADIELMYPNSVLLTYVYTLAAASHSSKQEYAEAIAKCEKALNLKSDNLMALLIVVPLMPQPQLLGGGDAEQKLKNAEDYANQALKQVDELKAEPLETPEQFASRKLLYQRDLHSALGMIHMQRAMQSLGEPDAQELELSEQEFQTAVTISTDPTTVDYYRLGEVLERQNKFDAAIQAFTRSSDLGAGTVVKAYADERIAALKKEK